MKTLTVICIVLTIALGAQTIRVAHLETELATQGRDLDAANTRVAQLEESEKSLVKARTGLTTQVEECQRANARAAEAAKGRAAVMKNAKAVPAQPGKVVDDETSRAAAHHINGSRR